MMRETFRSQRAHEAAVHSSPQVRDRLNDNEKIVFATLKSVFRIISKVGPLAMPADRDHCLQFERSVDGSDIRPGPGILFAILAFAGCFHTNQAGAEEALLPFDFSVVYTSEVWRNVRGGIREDSVYLDNLDATFEVDAERLWGWDDTRFFLYALYNNGQSFSEDKVGDRQVVSNIETGVEALRLYEAWVETPVAGSGSLLFGLFDLNSEFDVLESSSLFINSAHGIGTDFGQSGLSGPSIFPATSLAVRFHWQWNDRWSVRTAVFDGVPGDPDDPGATAVQLGDGEGALLVAELDWSDGDRRVLAGAWRYTADFEEWPDPSGPGPAQFGSGNGGLYLRGETALDAGVSLFGRIGMADASYNVFSGFLSAGLTWEAPTARRPDDTFGIAIAWAEASSAFRRAESAEAREIKAELTYRMVLGERFAVQPDIQYIINPGLDPTLDHAWAVGLRFELGVIF